MSRAHDHEVVSIYPFSEEEADALLTHARECVLMWSTSDGWPVGVTHAFVWHEGRLWLTFAAHRHRAAAIRRDPRVSVNVSSVSYSPRAPAGLPQGAITLKGTAGFFEDDATKQWFYPTLARKIGDGDPAVEQGFLAILDSPLRVMLAVTPVKRIMYNAGLANRHLAGAVSEEELGARLEGDRERMNRERARRGLPPR